MNTNNARTRVLLGFLCIMTVAVAALVFHSQGLVPDFSMIKMYRMDIEAYLMDNLLTGILIFACFYIAIVALSLPFATPLTLLGGFLFGSMLGTAIVSVSATVGATVAFLLIRFFFKEYTEEKFGTRLEAVNQEFTGHGFRDIFLMRLTPIIPFVLINAAAALTKVKTRDFFLASFLGMLPFTFIYVNAGTQLALIESPGDILSFPVILGISLLVVAVSLPVILTRRKHLPRSADIVQ